MHYSLGDSVTIGPKRYITRSQYSSMDAKVWSIDRVGFQPVSLRNLSVLPKMMFSSDGRMRRGAGLISALTPDRRIAVLNSSPIPCVVGAQRL